MQTAKRRRQLPRLPLSFFSTPNVQQYLCTITHELGMTPSSAILAKMSRASPQRKHLAIREMHLLYTNVDTPALLLLPPPPPPALLLVALPSANSALSSSTRAPLQSSCLIELIFPIAIFERICALAAADRFLS